MIAIVDAVIEIGKTAGDTIGDTMMIAMTTGDGVSKKKRKTDAAGVLVLFAFKVAIILSIEIAFLK
jgi:hypothetical protein